MPTPTRSAPGSTPSVSAPDPDRPRGPGPHRYRPASRAATVRAGSGAVSRPGGQPGHQQRTAEHQRVGPARDQTLVAFEAEDDHRYQHRQAQERDDPARYGQVGQPG